MFGWRRIHDPIFDVPEFLGTKASQRLWGHNALLYQQIATALHMACHHACDNAVAGDFAEFGTNSGRTAHVLAASLASFKSDKALHFFDSPLRGFQKPLTRSTWRTLMVLDGGWAMGACQEMNEAQLTSLCLRYVKRDRLHVHRGWYSNIGPRIDRKIKFSLVHLDCDLYQSTVDALDPLFANRHVSKGAVLLFDDWNCCHASDRHGQRAAWNKIEGKFCVRAENAGQYGCAGQRFIVHDYTP